MNDEMMASTAAAVDRDFAAAVFEGLAAAPKSLPCRYLYDARGSDLFEQITAVEEYYPTRTETAILQARVSEIAARTAPGSVLVEFGSGSSKKTEILLERLQGLAAYAPIDVSESALEDARERLSRRFPSLRIAPILGDFADEPSLPNDLAGAPRLGFFPGSTIGNLTHESAVKLLRHMGRTLGTGSRLILGVDLKKDTRRLIEAYDDRRGVTAAFNLNLLIRINRELGGDFDVGFFRHQAVYNPDFGRMEMHLVSLRPQQAHILGRAFRFEADETIHTENSYKYSLEQFRALAARAGWRALDSWRDADNLFSVHDLVFG